jgi:hypothetical protein
MANINKPAGLTPVRYLNGADWTGQGNWYYIDGTTDTNVYAVGDVVTLVAGLDAQSGLQTVSLATAGATAVGVILAVGSSTSLTTSMRGGPVVDPTNLNLVTAPATKTKNYFALVADDPNIVFMAQEVSGGTQLTKTATSKNVNFIYAAPATGVAVSGTMINNVGVAVTATLNLKLLGLAQLYDNGIYNTYGAYAKWLCLLNNHYYCTGRAGI